MIRSMTAFGRAEKQTADKAITVEMKSVNNRYFDCTVKIPRAYACLEERVKSYIQTRGISRGKLDVYISVDILSSKGVDVGIDTAYTRAYINALKSLRDDFSLKDDISVMNVARNSDIFNVRRPADDIESDWLEIKSVLDGAIDAFIKMRTAEGERLKLDLLEKKHHLEELADRLSKYAAVSVENYEAHLRAKLEQTLSEFNIEVDSQRILTECAIFADKVAVDEELVRLNSHFKAFDEIFTSNEPVGRKLDFLVQEINREINTTGSKANNSDMAKIVIEMKCEVEKIREQIQNLE